MILVRAQLTIIPENRSAFLEHLRKFIDASRGEAGCLSFRCYEEVDKPDAFTVLEEWQDRQRFEQHEQSNHLAQFKSRVGAMIASREATRVYTIDSIGEL